MIIRVRKMMPATDADKRLLRDALSELAEARRRFERHTAAALQALDDIRCAAEDVAQYSESSLEQVLDDAA